MQSSGRRKREVCSCLPCYTRKQKCNRQYPCDRCTRRRQPELCVYASSPPAPTTKKRDEDMQISDNNWEQHNKDDENDDAQTFNSSPTVVTTGRTERSESSLAKAYGYYGRSEYTTMALVRKLVHEDDIPDAQDAPISNEIAAEVRKTLDKMLSRSILDFLVRYFVTKVNWIEQLSYAPWFLTQYQRWWSLDRLSSVADIEFPILFLRICCYASQYLPSPSYTIDSIKGVALVNIRKSCEEVINALAPICVRLDPQGSLIRVLHILFAGLGSLCIGRMNAFWESLSCGTRVAQQIGLHRDTIKWSISADELEKEMTRRAICNIYIWDSCLSKRLDRIPFLPDILSEDFMPRMRLLPDTEIGTDVPDVFTERILRAQLAQFWRNHGAAKDSEYDAIAAEERYEKFCADFLQTLPSAFALQPDKQWDTRLPTLPMQRQLLHNAIFEHLCWNFRPVLFQRLDLVQHLPGYKRILITHNKQALAVASLALLDGVSNLHTMMGGSHTRFSGVIVPTFEATVPLLCLYADKNFPEEIAPESPSHVIMKADPIGNGIRHVTRAKCMQAACDALACLQNLAEVSNLAETGARTLARLIHSIESSPPYAETYGDSTTIAINLAMQTSEDWNYSQVQEYALGDSQAIFQCDNGQCREIGPSWEEMLQDLNGSFLPGEFGSF